jgi:hypothetical protein
VYDTEAKGVAVTTAAITNIAEPVNTTPDGKSQTIKAQYQNTSTVNVCCYHSTYGATGVAEPIFGLDIDADSDRGNWFERNMFEAQPYMKYGVASDDKFRAQKEGKTIDNVYVAGSVLSGFNAIKEGCGAGVSILTALNVADSIVEN